MDCTGCLPWVLTSADRALEHREPGPAWDCPDMMLHAFTVPSLLIASPAAALLGMDAGHAAAGIRKRDEHRECIGNTARQSLPGPASRV